MNGYVDIHAHVLPGIDDGPADMEDALQMLKAAAGCGISTIAATPHVRADFPDVHVAELAGRCQAVRDRIAAEDLGIEVVCGAEVSLVWAVDASDEQLRLVTYGQRGTDVLIEAARFDPLNVRKTSRALGLHSDSSYRFERPIDPVAPRTTMVRGGRV